MEILHARHALLPSGWARDVTLEIAGGRIRSVSADQPAPASARQIGILLPAPANVHSHAFQRAMAGLTEMRSDRGQDSFWTWRQQMYRFLEHLTPDDVEAIAAQVMVETAEAGFAALGEFHYLHHAPGGMAYADPAEMAGRIVAAAQTTGLGLTLLPVLYQQGGCDGRALNQGQRRFGNDPDRFAEVWAGAARAMRALPGDAVIGVAPHSLRAVTPEGLDFAAGLAPEAPIHIHAAEQLAEVDEVQAHFGARPVEWLIDRAGVNGRWCLIHATQMTAAETDRLAASGAVAGLCPITEANLGDGIFDGARFAAAGGAMAVGSDSNVRIALAEELRLLEYSQRLRDKARTVLAAPGGSNGRALWQAVTHGGARAVGRNSGAIAPGLCADLVAFDDQDLSLVGRSGDALIDSVIFARGEAALRSVWSAGREIVRDGRHIAREPVGAKFRATMLRLKDAM